MGLIDNINKLFDHRIRLGMMSCKPHQNFGKGKLYTDREVLHR